ncbi:endo-1,3-1,4-beta-glycanase, C-terminal secretion signal protein [Haloferula helveola]|uniref:Endo-1,3-1,4-beta-glycanase, C-terminal secretion signal protein n=1 Tax=Haloferula helveola TaxID=490095 RepID=A0ABM7RDI4_9BACT|nr:endo-1,3-1,4-beta-glycanase, C-terminal secretion signal protein [Haloferula helveola]
MKPTAPLWISGGLLVVAGVALLPRPSAESTAPERETATAPRARLERAAIRTAPLRETLAPRGHLWEPHAETAAEARRHSIPIRAEAFASIREAKAGDRLKLDLSRRIPNLDAEVANDAVQDDGTRVTHLMIAGTPEGELIIQENQAAGFFLAQLYYENDPVAYEFRESGDGLVAERHPVSDLICSMVGNDGEVLAMGLPEPEIMEGRGNGNGGGGNGGGGNGGGGGRTISISDASITEGTGGSSELTFTLTLSSSDKKNDITVDFATSDGTATAPDDYTATSGTAVIPRRSTQTTVTVPVNPDSLAESDETLTVTLSNASGASLGTATATGTILNDDQGPTLSTFNIVTYEGDSGTTTVNFSVDLSQAAASPVTVDYATADGSAFAGSDYVATSGSLTFLPGETTKLVPVQVIGDTDYEYAEAFSLVLSNAVGAPIDVAQAGCLILNDDLSPSTVPLLDSLPGATAVAYLDMDGHVSSGTPWNGGNTIVAQGIAGTFTQAAMTDIWKRVAEDFAPFQINVTTDEAAYLAAPPAMRTRCVITPDNEWYGAAGGVAYLNSFTWTGDTPCWVFSDMLSNSGSYIAEACSHEIGHTLGLLHDGRTTPSEAYYQGHGTGETGWAPIMGVGYYRWLTQWSKGEYLNANNPEDDLAIITGQNGFGYRTDDHADSSGAATPLDRNGLFVHGEGLITTSSDLDVFSFTITAAGPVGILVEAAYPSANLDILAEIRDVNGTLLASDNHPDILRSNPVVTLNPGTYYLHVSGTGKGDPQVAGYTDYGSLGAYTVNGQTP